jgi:hypothetical protein
MFRPLLQLSIGYAPRYTGLQNAKNKGDKESAKYSENTLEKAFGGYEQALGFAAVKKLSGGKGGSGMMRAWNSHWTVLYENALVYFEAGKQTQKQVTSHVAATLASSGPLGG